MRYVTLMLSSLLLTTQLVAQPTSPVGVQLPYMVERWTRNLEKADAALKAEEWKKGRKKAQNVLDEMCDRIEGGEGAAELVGTATFLRALAEAGLGNTAAASTPATRTPTARRRTGSRRSRGVSARTCQRLEP